MTIIINIIISSSSNNSISSGVGDCSTSSCSSSSSSISIFSEPFIDQGRYMRECMFVYSLIASKWPNFTRRVIIIYSYRPHKCTFIIPTKKIQNI